MIFENGIIKTPDLEFNENSGGVGCILYETLKQYENRIALINSHNDEFITYKELLKRSISTAIALEKRGIKQHDLMAICSRRENLDGNVPIIAGQFLGCITYALDPNETIEVTANLLEQVQPRIIFVTESSKQLIFETLKKINIQVEIVEFGEQFKHEFLGLENSDFKPLFIENLKTTCMIHFSSGSTGTPKPICLNHYYYMALIGPIPHPKSEPCTRKFANHMIGSVSLRISNWYWISTSIEMVDAMWNGKCRLLKDIFDVDQIWFTIAKYKIADIFFRPVDIPLFPSKLPPSLDVSCLRKVFISGNALHEDLVDSLKQLLPEVELVSMYAMTECGVVTYSYVEKFKVEKPTCCGLPVSGLHYKIIDLETGKICGFKQPGELHVKGKRVFNGFHNLDSSECFDDEGYFKTGDVVYFDEDFCFFFVDRIKALLKWKNKLIYPSCIEEVLRSHPAVNDAMVIGIEDKVEAERLMGVVILKNDVEDLSEVDLVKYVEERVEDYKRLREGVVFVKHFPTTITGKPNRLKVKQMALELMKRNVNIKYA
ncbi:unnamed protein product [Ceutorhynchus assimilis]|uniref:Uncharacterized protein n=1 Tax=Ceutorhynchus assimilis TaxID=467358 RepID=A0A9N9MVD7_9CUCU|nr:unnamed protein product [Ceutorhynchus assimilis]